MDRSQFLQVMRFVAAALVLCTHATFYYHDRISLDVAIWHFGEIGVPIFFVISGIVMVVSTRNGPDNALGAKAFMLRRIIRIVPLWWVALGIKVVIGLVRPEVVNHNHVQLGDAVKSLLFIPYFNEAHAVVPLHGVGWTLLHEMFFYLLFSAAMLCRLRPAPVTSAIIVALWLIGMQVHLDNPFWAVATSPANLQFVIGMVVGMLLVKPAAPGAMQAWRRVGALALAGAGAALWLLPQPYGVHHGLPVVLVFGAATLLLSQVELPGSAGWLVKLGDSSYSLYLFHPFVAPAALLVLGRLAPGLPPALHIGIAIVFTIAVAHATHLAVEVPVVRFARDQLVGPPLGTKRLSNAS